MGQSFVACDREQSFLMPPDVRDWLPEAHFAWFVIDAVAEMDLDGFYAAYRQEALALRWGDIRERTILVERAVSLGQEKDTKTHAHRTVRLLGPLREDLLAWKMRAGPAAWRGARVPRA